MFSSSMRPHLTTVFWFLPLKELFYENMPCSELSFAMNFIINCRSYV